MGNTQGLVWLALVVHLTGCDEHNEVALSIPTAAIARGAYLPFSVSDGCTGGGKASICTTEKLVSVDSFSVDDPSIASILRMEDLTQAQQVPGDLVIDARRAGTTSLTIEATFDDGTKRTAKQDIVVQDIDSVKLHLTCSVRFPENELAFPVGKRVPMWTNLLHGETELRGEYQDTLIEGQGLARKFGGLTGNSFEYTPTEAGTTTLTSPVDAAFSHTLRNFTPDEASIAAVELKYEAEVRYLDFVAFDLDLKVDGKRPCFYPPLHVETLTPDVCDGDNGAVSWLEESPDYGVSVRGLRSGTCKFTLAIEGNDQQPYLIETQLKVSDAPEPYVDPCAGESCEPVTSCAAGKELVRRDCCNACEPQPDPAQCEAERQTFDALYEPQLEQASACDVDDDCTSVVLIGGCRRYCFVATRKERTADFMNAISEQYYTSCGSCLAGTPANCEGDGRPVCREGRCAMPDTAAP